MQKNDFDYEGYIAINEVAQYLSIKVKTLYAKVVSENIPHYRIGRLIRFKKEDIDTWMEGNKAVKKHDANIPRGTRRGGGGGRKVPSCDVDRIVKKTIDQVKVGGYTSSYGKPDRIKDLGKEVGYGDI
ncbi:MAG: helix-turn-helix domain-containing protein [Syntrophales bacterium]